jgi:hypothetical protein
MPLQPMHQLAARGVEDQQGPALATRHQPAPVRAQGQVDQVGTGAAIDPIRLAATQVHEAGQQVAGVAAVGGDLLVQAHGLAEYPPGGGVVLAFGQEGGMCEAGLEELLGALLSGPLGVVLGIQGQGLLLLGTHLGGDGMLLLEPGPARNSQGDGKGDDGDPGDEPGAVQLLAPAVLRGGSLLLALVATGVEEPHCKPEVASVAGGPGGGRLAMRAPIQGDLQVRVDPEGALALFPATGGSLQAPVELGLLGLVRGPFLEP